MSGFHFHLHSQHGRARRGRIDTPHGSIETPEFLPVGTQGTCKAILPRDLVEAGTQGMLANTYHLFLRPGSDRIKSLGGLHQFMGWNRPLMTDSGGFQAFSLGISREHGVGKIGGFFPGGVGTSVSAPTVKLVQISEEGVEFRSHLDGTRHLFSPEASIRIQEELGADMILAFDECTSPVADRLYTERSMERTHRWAVRSLQARRDTPQALYGILQGGAYEDLRERSLAFIASLPFQGFAIGGSLGNNKDEMHKVLDWTAALLPADRPRHLLGIGDIADLFEGVERGVDTFDCVSPTRFGRHGHLFVGPTVPGRNSRGMLNLINAQYKLDERPVDPDCGCHCCTNFSRAYLRHLYKAGETLATQLGSLHNVHFLLNLMSQIRQALVSESFSQLKARWVGATVVQNTCQR
jgi:queuine tRNA-ribosyltransferase